MLLSLALAHWDRRRVSSGIMCMRRWRLPVGIAAASLMLCMCALLALAHWDRRRFASDQRANSALGVWEGVVLSIAPARLSASAEGGVDYGRRLHCSAGVCPLPSVQGSHQKETRLVPLGWSPRPSNHTCAWQALAFRIVAATPKTPQTQHAATVFQRAGITYSSLAGWLR